MKTVDDQDRVLVSLARGEEVPQQLARFCVERGIPHATIEGIGAIEGITIGAYDLGEPRSTGSTNSRAAGKFSPSTVIWAGSTTSRCCIPT